MYFKVSNVKVLILQEKKVPITLVNSFYCLILQLYLILQELVLTTLQKQNIKCFLGGKVKLWQLLYLNETISMSFF